MEAEVAKAKTKQERLEKKRRKEKHWELLRWLVNFIEENKQQWEENRQKRKEDQEKTLREEEWRTLTKQQKLNQLQREEEAKKEEISPEMRKKRRQEECMQRSRNWKTWREEHEDDTSEEEPEENQPTEDIKVEEVAYKASKEAEQAREEEEEELTEVEETRKFCLDCAHRPCLCMMLRLELRLKMLRGVKTIKTKEKQTEAEVEQEGQAEVAEDDEVVDEVVPVVSVLLQEEVLELPAKNQVENATNPTNKILLSLPLDESPELDKPRTDGPVHRGRAADKPVSRTQFHTDLKPAQSHSHGPIHREKTSSETANREVREAAHSEVVSHETEVVSDHCEPHIPLPLTPHS